MRRRPSRHRNRFQELTASSLSLVDDDGVAGPGPAAPGRFAAHLDHAHLIFRFHTHAEWGTNHDANIWRRTLLDDRAPLGLGIFWTM